MAGVLDLTRKDVTVFLRRHLAEKKRTLGSVNDWARDALAKLEPFVAGGKMLRAGLVAAGSAVAGRRPGWAAVRAGAAVELIQAALLIHDDIMDRDSLRRGIPSLHRQYARQAGPLGAADPDHFGEGMGLCVGDIAFFLGFELLAGLPAPAGMRSAVVAMWSEELCRVGLAQMQDLYFGETFPAVSDSDIRRLYRFKTARYSFSLPLMTGARLAGAPPGVCRSLETLGETMGVLFQLRDDELGLHGSEAELGKPVGSDIRESKLTLHTRRLFERASRRDRAKLEKAFGNRGLTAPMLREVRAIADKLGIRAGLRAEMLRLQARAGRAIARLDAPPAARRILGEFLDYCLDRQK